MVDDEPGASGLWRRSHPLSAEDTVSPSTDLRLLCVLAHPDDESLGTGGALALAATHGVSTYLVTATRGERGRFGTGNTRPAPEVVGRTREAELRAAAAALGVRDVCVLGYPDGGLDAVDPIEAASRIAGHIRRVKPHVVITFGPEGAYGHPDHIAISQFTTAAIVAAAAATPFAASVPGEPHAVSKLYFIAWSAAKWSAYQAALKRLVATVDGQEREVTPWPDWGITTVIDTASVWPTVWRAVSCHQTQMAIYEKLSGLSDDLQRALWGTQEFYRVFSTVNGGRARETDLFEGL
jgi:LmbE family N-acetylglucosaminyl deacetylase